MTVNWALLSGPWLRVPWSVSPAEALEDGDTAVGAGAALQRGLGLDLSTTGVKDEDAVGAVPMFIPPTKNVDFAITHRHATALLSKQADS